MTLRYQPLERVEFQATASCNTNFLTQSPASSWAAPHVTALVARLLSLHPELKPFEVKAALKRMAAS
jgi:subtilisin